MKLESKIGKIVNTDEQVYNFLTDFNNFKNLIPEDKISDWESDEDSCSFSVNPIGKTGIKIVEKEPFKLIKLASLEEDKYNFTFWVQLKMVEENDTRIKLTLKADLNPMIQMMAKKPLQEFLDKLVDQLVKYDFG
ncbi:MAG: SRPBCC family protein [Bacteroidales bacterium]|jgi:carbon monoxide dehydrogenase subunit G